MSCLYSLPRDDRTRKGRHIPNLLAHLGAQGALSKAAGPRLDCRWLLLACVLPDLPWIAQRALRVVQMLSQPFDAYDLRLYAVAQSSLFVTLVLCAAVALLSSAPRLIFLVLALNALLHLLLDAAQTKLANGVHLLAPFDWRLVSWRLFWPESWPAVLLTGAGLAVIVWCWRQPGEPIGLTLRPGRVAASTLLLLLYLVLPATLLRGPEATDSHFVRTLRQRDARPGRQVELDRVLFEEGRIGTFALEELEVTGAELNGLRRVSLSGRFVDLDTIAVDELHVHWPLYRDAASYVGLFFIALFWVVPRRKRKRLRNELHR